MVAIGNYDKGWGEKQLREKTKTTDRSAIASQVIVIVNFVF